MPELHNNMPDGFVYVLDSGGHIIRQYDYDAVAAGGLPCYMWPEGTKFAYRPTAQQKIHWLQKVYDPVGPVYNV